MIKGLLFIFILRILGIISDHQAPQILAVTEQTTIAELTPNQQAAHETFELGQHFIVGFGDIDELNELIRLGAIGGVFIREHNVAGKTREEIQTVIANLQSIQSSNKLPPLFIATDQEGGVVARLTPPLTSLPPLSSLVDQSNCTNVPNSCFTATERELVRVYANTQAHELNILGINLNFAPIVDIYQGIQVKNDVDTHLESRSLSSFPWLVAEISKIYVRVMIEHGITPTLKHFPGLGSATKDSHLTSVHLRRSLSDFETFDWIPFKVIIQNTQPAIMLSHTIVDAIDPSTPASYSPLVIQYLRHDLGFDGLLITDDFSMAPIQFGKDGVSGASVKAISAGIDLILITSSDLFPFRPNHN